MGGGVDKVRGRGRGSGRAVEEEGGGLLQWTRKDRSKFVLHEAHEEL